MARTLVMVLLVCFAAVACGGSDGREGAIETQVEAPTVEVAMGSPLEVEVGFSSEPNRRNEQLITLQRRANEQVVVCMQAAGFEYFAAPIDRSRLLGPRAGAGTRDWVSVNGLGITTSLLELTAGTAGAGSPLDAASANASYTAQLDPDASARYDAALIGAIVPGADALGGDAAPDPIDATEPQGGFAPTGCWGSAYNDLVLRLRLADQLADELVLLNDRVRADPRMLALMTDWSGCMNDRGHAYVDRESLLDDFYARSLAIEIVDSAAGPTLGDPNAVDTLLADEIAVALDDVDCREPLAAQLTELRSVYERELLADNRAAINATLQTGS